MTSITFYLTIAVVLVGGVISWAIMDSVIVETLETSNVNLESHSVAGASGTFNVNNVPLISISNITNNAYNQTPTATINNLATGEVAVSGINTSQGACCEISYTYDDATYLNSDLSRTIVAYIVPIGLLGLLGIVVFTRRD